MPEFRGCTTDAVLDTLDKLQALWGYRYRVQVVEHLANEAAARYLAPTHYDQAQARALKVLKRLKPSLLIESSDITGVAFTNQGNTVEVSVSLEPQPYKIPRREWEK